MSYFMKTTEEIKINNCNDKTKFITKMLVNYIRCFENLPRMRFYEITDAEFSINGRTLTLGHFYHDGHKLSSEITRGKNKGNLSPVGSKPSLFYTLMNWIICAEHVEGPITFRINYECECVTGCSMGHDYWADIFLATDCEELRENVEYNCLETYDCEQDMVVAFMYNRNFFGYYDFPDSTDFINPVSSWELEAYSSIAFCEREGNPLKDIAVAHEIIEKITPLLEKYDLTVDDYTDGDDEIQLAGYVTLTGKQISEFLVDFQKLFYVLKPYNLALYGFANYLICRDYNDLGTIGFELDEDYNLRSYYRGLKKQFQYIK